MENQHRLIKGYRELTAGDIDLMNRIKLKGRELLDLHAEVLRTLEEKRDSIGNALLNGAATGAFEQANAERERFEAAEPYRWASIGKTDIQTGISALVRAVAQPEGV